MNPEVLIDSINTVSLENELEFKTVIERQISVPSGYPMPESIVLLRLDGMMQDIAIDAGTIKLNYSIRVKTLYNSISKENTPCGFFCDEPFSSEYEIENNDSTKKSLGNCLVEHVEYNIDSTGKINITAVIRLKVMIYNEKTLQVPTYSNSSNNLQILEKNINSNIFAGVFDEVLNLSVDSEVPMEKPPVREILWYDIRPVSMENMINNSEIDITAAFLISIIYRSEFENEVEVFEKEFDISHTLSTGSDNSISDCKVTINPIMEKFDINEDTDGESRILTFGLRLSCTTQVFQETNECFIEDVFGTKKIVESERESLNLKEIVDISTSEIDIKESFSIADGENAYLFHHIIFDPYITYISADDKALEVTGVLNTSLVYSTNDGAHILNVRHKQIPFTHNATIDENISEYQSFEAAISTYTVQLLNNSQYDIEFLVSATLVVNTYKKQKLQCVTSFEESNQDAHSEKSPSYVVYYTKPDDTLWSIAKKFKTTIPQLMEFNNIEQRDSIKPGMQIFIRSFSCC